jgi:hypothetical protein
LSILGGISVKKTTIFIVSLLLVLVLSVRADFVLIGSEHLDVYEGHRFGVLWDSSSANIFEGLFQGTQFRCYDNSRIEILGGVHDGTVDQFADPTLFNLYNNSVINVYGGDFKNSVFRLRDNSGLAISGGVFLDGEIDSGGLQEYSCIVNISGGIFGRSYMFLVYRGSTLNLYGIDFRSIDSTIIIGSDNRVSGSGLLSCKWFDGSGTVIRLLTVSGSVYLHYEPLTEIPYCSGSIPGDLDSDCRVDMNDLAILVSNWLKCNLDPQTSCWE